MKYLSKEPFTIAVSSRPVNTQKKRTTAQPKKLTQHEYAGGSMCVICGLDEKAKIHELSNAR